MQIKDMYRTDWTRIKEREYISRECTLNGLPARESLIYIRDITSPLTVTSAGQPVKVVEKNYSWIQIAQKDALWWLTAMFDEKGALLQMYFDITAGNCFDNPENPTFRDMYLDYVLRPDGVVVTLDEDELTEALEKGEITQEEFDQTLQAGSRLHAHLTGHPIEVMDSAGLSTARSEPRWTRAANSPNHQGEIAMCLICDRIQMIKEGTNPYFVRELETGYVVIGDHQHFKGYTLFLCKEHETELFRLAPSVKLKFLEEMSLVAEAASKAFHAEKMNYELLGNGDSHLHWHLFPRVTGDLENYVEGGKGPVWWYPREKMYAEDCRPTKKELEEMKARLSSALARLI